MRGGTRVGGTQWIPKSVSITQASPSLPFPSLPCPSLPFPSLPFLSRLLACFLSFPSCPSFLLVSVSFCFALLRRFCFASVGFASGKVTLSMLSLKTKSWFPKPSPLVHNLYNPNSCISDFQFTNPKHLVPNSKSCSPNHNSSSNRSGHESFIHTTWSDMTRLCTCLHPV